MMTNPSLSSVGTSLKLASAIMQACQLREISWQPGANIYREDLGAVAKTACATHGIPMFEDVLVMLLVSSWNEAQEWAGRVLSSEVKTAEPTVPVAKTNRLSTFTEATLIEYPGALDVEVTIPWNHQPSRAVVARFLRHRDDWAHNLEVRRLAGELVARIGPSPTAEAATELNPRWKPSDTSRQPPEPWYYK